MFHWRVAAVGLVVLALSLLALPAKAHDAGTYTVILKAGGPEPANTPHLEENITVLWINTDNNTENVTHRILLDADGDGVYNGSADIDSGELQGECEKDDNGTLVDEDCHVSFELTFNGTLSNGTFAYQDRLSDSTLYHGNVTVEPHVDGGDSEGETQVHDDTHAHDDEEPATEEPATESDISSNWLLWVAGLSAGGAALLGALLMRQGGSG